MPVFIEERHQKILEMVQKNGRVEVQELCRTFGISEDSARRDLRLMERAGQVERTYGGAILPREAAATPFEERGAVNAENKKSIAALAASYVQDGDALFLDASTTVAKMVPLLAERKNLTVFTHSVEIARAVLSVGGIGLFLIGGTVDPRSAAAFGAETCEQIGRLNTDCVFTAPCGLSAGSGLSCAAAEEAPVKRAVLGAGREVFLLVPGEELGKRALVSYAPLLPEYTVLTDSSYRPSGGDEFSGLAARGLKILAAGQAEK